MPSISVAMVLLILGFFVLGVTFYCALFAAVGSTVNSEQEARQAAMPVIFMIVPAILLAQPVLLNPMSTLAQTLSWLPFTAPVITPMRMMLVPLSPLEVGGSLLSVAVACAVTVWLAARIYRTGILMYGKRPSLMELGRWVRRSA
jgi:ABC-2 type transport system permease protein